MAKPQATLRSAYRGRLPRRTPPPGPTASGSPRRSRRHAAGGGDPGTQGRSRRRSRRGRWRRRSGGGEARRRNRSRAGRDRRRPSQALRRPMRMRMRLPPKSPCSMSNRPPTPSPPPILHPDSLDIVLINPPFNDAARRRISPGQGARDRACRDRDHAFELDSRKPAHPEIPGRADADLARRRDCRGAGRARSRFWQPGNPAGSRRCEGACEPACWFAPPRVAVRRRKFTPA